MGNHVAVIEGQNSGLVLSDRTYDVLRQFVEKVLPGIGALYFGLSVIWGWPEGDRVVASCAALAVFGGVLLSLARKGYVPPVELKDPHYDGEVVADVIDGKGAVRLELNDASVQNLMNKQNLLIKGISSE